MKSHHCAVWYHTEHGPQEAKVVIIEQHVKDISKQLDVPATAAAQIIEKLNKSERWIKQIVTKKLRTTSKEISGTPRSGYISVRSLFQY